MMKKLAAVMICGLIGAVLVPACSSDEDGANVVTPVSAASILPIQILDDPNCDGVADDCYSFEYDTESIPDSLLIRGSLDEDCDGIIDETGCNRFAYDKRGYIVMESGSDCEGGTPQSVCFEYDLDDAGRMTMFKEDGACDDQEPECTLYDYSVDPGRVAVGTDANCDGVADRCPEGLVKYVGGSPAPKTAWDLLSRLHRNMLEERTNPACIDYDSCKSYDLDAQGYAVQAVLDDLCDGKARERLGCAAYSYDKLGRMLEYSEVDCETETPTRYCTEYVYADHYGKATESGPPKDFDDGGPAPAPSGPGGAFTATFENADGTGINCPATQPTPTVQIGTVDATQYDAVFNGENGASITCDVHASGEGFVVSGEILQGLTTFRLPELAIQVGQVSHGSLKIGASNTNGWPYSPADGESCIFQVIDASGERAWLSFECSHVTTGKSELDQCAIRNGFVVFEGCGS